VRPTPGAPPPAAAARAEPLPRPRLLHVALAFGIVYVVWGSTYLGMRVALEGIPPLAIGAVRFTIAGLLLGAWVAWRERPAWPDAAQWRWAGLTGLLLMVGGNLGVLLAEQRIASGPTALLAASLAIWMVLLDWLRPGGTRPNALVALGVLVGLGGVAVLVGPAALVGGAAGGHGGTDPLGAAFVLGGSLAWAAGSLLARSAAAPRSPMLGAAMQMLCGGALLLVLALLHGDAPHLAPATWGPRATAALAYLVVFGSLVGFTAYIWLMRHVAPARVATYAYVNPVVAVLLGWALGGEAIGARTGWAAAVIVGAVALITVGRGRPTRAR
jgi:drug/metabolite transporter (DMT)-like permease